MGKKSRKGAAKSKAGASSAAGAGGGDFADGVVTASGTLTSTAGSTKKRSMKCVRCYGNVKEGKGESCPGCSLLYCCRGEMKWFGECPHGDNCVYPLRRCLSCAMGDTMAEAMEVSPTILHHDTGTCRKWQGFKPEEYQAFAKLIRSSKKPNLSTEAIPIRCCEEPGCRWVECYRCVTAPSVSRLIRCVACDRTRCFPCLDKLLEEAGDIPGLRDTTMTALCSGRNYFTEDEIRTVGEAMRDKDPRLVTKCMDCNLWRCFGCLDERSMNFLAARELYRYLGPLAEGVNSPGDSFRCTTCYWSSKPCTNPTCPSEVGVPTKRCGGCHIDRYCSVECQATAYPAHVARCGKIQTKRATDGKVASK